MDSTVAQAILVNVQTPQFGATMVVIDLDDFEALEPIQEETITKNPEHQVQKTLFDMDDASYPSSIDEQSNDADAFAISRVDLDESVLGSTSSSDGEEVLQHDSREGTLPRKSSSPRKQQQRQERIQESHSRRLVYIVLAFVVLVGIFVAFLQFWWKQQPKLGQSSETKPRDPNSCHLCPEGFALSTPFATFDSKTSPSSVRGLTCGQVWEKAESGEYNSSLFCALIKAETSTACECNKVLESVEVGSPVAGPTASPVSAFPTASPTIESLYVPPNPVPQNRARSYFNYDSTDTQFGPNNWSRIDMTGTYFREFGQDGFGTWSGHLQHHVADSTLNRCGHRGKQSPVNLIETTWGESDCTAAHQIRTRVSSVAPPIRQLTSSVRRVVSLWPMKASKRVSSPTN